MRRKRRILAVDRMSTAQLWREMIGQLAVADRSLDQTEPRSLTSAHVRRAMECAVELHMRGTQLGLGLETAAPVHNHYEDGNR